MDMGQQCMDSVFMCVDIKDYLRVMVRVSVYVCGC